MLAGSLLSLPLPSLNNEQLESFKNLKLHKAFSFAPHAIIRELAENEGKNVTGIELGGDKLTLRHYQIKNKSLLPVSEVEIFYSTHDKGYLQRLEELAPALKHSLVGLSFAGPVRQEEIIAAPNMQEFLHDLKVSKHQGSLKSLLPSLSYLINDAASTLLPSVMEEAVKNAFLSEMVLLINGSGLGGAVWKKDKTGHTFVYTAEPGHIEVSTALNPLRSQTSCNILGNTHVCIENIASGKAGIETLYHAQTGCMLRGFEISELYQSGQKLATTLYDTSATLMSHTYLGLLKAAGITYNPETTVLALHGGVSLVPDYTKRITQILRSKNFLSHPVRIRETKSVTKHSGIMGAALAAFIH